MIEYIFIMSFLLFIFSLPFVISNWGMYFTYKNYKKEAIVSTVLLIISIVSTIICLYLLRK